MTGSEQKIKGQHRERLAAIYLRQSSPRQVRENFRSTERQYGLAEEAVKLGWEPERVLTIDGDLGISGRDAHPREAYKELVARVCLGEVGAIFGLEVSRLARSSAETQRLLEYCGLTDTLVIDTDGIYDLRDFNDQLILGVKGQLAQAELHMMGVRLQGAKRHAAERGELRFPLPVGLAYDADGHTIIDPDQEVQAAIADVLKAFAQTGSAYGVVGVFAGRRFPRRAYGGAWAGELRWGKLTHARVLGVLRNPSYSGTYVFGRYRYRRLVRPDGTITTSMIELPRSEWAVVIHDHHEGYISWERFLANQERLAHNNTRNGQRPAREGKALCQGIVRCGACGGSMTTLHRREGRYYECGHSRADHVGRAVGGTGAGRDRRADGGGGLGIHLDKTRIVYCQDGDRRGNHEHTSFYLPGYARARKAQQERAVLQLVPARDERRGAQGQRRPAAPDAHLPAHQPDAGRPGAMAEPHHRRLDQLLRPVLPVRDGAPPAARQHLPEALGCEEYYKRLRAYKRFKRWWTGLLQRAPGLFAHWRVVRTDGPIRRAR